MAHQVERREADGEEVRRGPLPQLHAVDGGRGQASEGGIRVGTFLPRRIEERAGPAVALLQGVRHLAVPLVWRFLAQALVVKLVVRLLGGPIPAQPEVVLDGRALGRAKQRLLRRRRPGRRRAPTSTLEPQHRVATSLAGQHRRRRALERQRHQAPTGLGDGCGERGRLEHLRAAARSGLTLAVGHFARAAVVGARHGPLGGPIPPLIADDAVSRWESARADGGVARAGQRRGVWVGRVREPRALVDQAPQTLGPLRTVILDVVPAHLIDDDDDDQRRLGRLCVGRAGRQRQAECRADEQNR